METIKGARLDRAICNIEWKEFYKEAFISHLARVRSDHCPILLSSESVMTPRRTPRFKFQPAWLSHPNFLGWLESTWKQGEYFITMNNDLTEKISNWKNQVFGDVNKRKRWIRARIEGVQRCLVDNASPGLLKLERKLQIELETILLQEELLWFQKSRCQWLESGDRNTKFYHLATTVRGQKKKIHGLEDSSGAWVTDQESLCNMAIEYFKKLYQKDSFLRPSLLKGCFPPLDSDNLACFFRPITGNDVQQALFQMDPHKASGLDGYSALLYQKSWHVIGAV